MRVYLDTNILMDYLLPERCSYEEAAIILEMGKRGLVELYLSTQSILDSIYLTRKASEPLRIRKAIHELSRFINIVPIGLVETDKALRTEGEDVEDIAQSLTADGLNCDLIITNDKDFPFCPEEYPPMHMTSAEFVETCRRMEAI